MSKSAHFLKLYINNQANGSIILSFLNKIKHTPVTWFKTRNFYFQLVIGFLFYRWKLSKSILFYIWYWF